MNENLNNQGFNNNGGQSMMNQPTGVMASNNNQNKGNDFVNELLKDKPRLIGLIGYLVALISFFVPFLVMEVSFLGQSASESITYWSTSDGKIVFFVTLVAAALIFFKKYVFAAIPVVISTIILIADLLDVADVTGGYPSYATIKWGIGVYLAIIGLIAMAVSIFLYWKENKNCFKDTIDGVKNKFNKASANPGMNQTTSYTNQPQPMNQPFGGPVEPQVQPQPMNQSFGGPVEPQVQPQPMNQPFGGPVEPQVQQQPMNQPFGGPVEPQVQPQPMNDFNNQNNNF